MRKKWVLGLVGAASIAFALGVLAARYWMQHDPRRGLCGVPGVYVEVRLPFGEDAPPDLRPSANPRREIQGDVERWLHGAGIRVISRGQARDWPAYARLVAEVAVVSRGDAPGAQPAYHTALYLESNTPEVPSEAIWGGFSDALASGQANLPSIRKSMAALVDRFIRAYVAANPH
jgi:hypothetical protein